MTDAEWKGLATSIGAHVLVLGLAQFIVLGTPVLDAPPPPPVDIQLFDVEFGPAPGPMAVAPPPRRASRPAPERLRPGVERNPRPPRLPRAEGAIATPVAAARPDPPRPSPVVSAVEEETDEAPSPPEGPPPGTVAAGDPNGGRPTGEPGGRGSVEGQPGGTGGGTTGFLIGGLGDRSRLSGPLPSNPGVRGRGVYRITVSPEGRVTNVVPVRRVGRGGADDRAVRALRSWRFNSLPAEAGLQQGTITFDFTLI